MAVALFVGVGLYILFGGSGSFTHRTIGDSNFTIRYPVMLRQQSVGLFTVTFNNPRRDTVLHFDEPFEQSFSITAMTPQPTAMFDTTWGRGYQFAMDGPGPETVRINVSSGDTGQVNYTIIANGRMALLSTVILP